MLGARAARATPKVNAYAESLVARAHAMNLAEDREWLRLGHYRSRLFGGYKSEADGVDFFLADEGQTDASAELDATVRGLFSDVKVGKAPEYPICRFPARAAWLSKRLAFDASRLPVVECVRLAEYLARTQPSGATLVFSSYYMNNPASAFGHTFLRLHKRAHAEVGREKRELLDYGIDYSANADTGNPVIYAFKGMTGLFPGTFRLLPYFYKVREYNDYESRDLWEYELALQDDEVAMLALHIFELGATYFDYFSLDENCSYHILAALEAAVPRVELLSHIRTPVIPADTVKALYANPGFVREVRYRPSTHTQFRARVAHFTGEQLDVVQALPDDPEAPLPKSFSDVQRIQVFDAAADLVDIRFAKDLVHEPNGEGARIKQRILARRSEILLPSEELEVPTPWDKLPHIGHGSMRLATSAGYFSDVGPFMSLRYRLALHDLGDPPRGYPELSQIEFFPIDARFYSKPTSTRVELETASLLEITSLHEINRFDHGISWRVQPGVWRVRDDACPGCLAGGIKFGSGLTFGVGDHISVFGMGELRVEYSSALHGIEDTGFRFGAGPVAGTRIRLNPHLLVLAEAGLRYFPLAVVKTGWDARGEVRWEYTREFGAGVIGETFVNSEAVQLASYLYF